MAVLSNWLVPAPTYIYLYGIRPIADAVVNGDGCFHAEQPADFDFPIHPQQAPARRADQHPTGLELSVELSQVALAGLLQSVLVDLLQSLLADLSQSALADPSQSAQVVMYQ